MKAVNLKCDYEVTPLGIQTHHPIFSWQIESETPVMQSAYRVAAASSVEGLKNGVFDVFDSGKVDSARTYGVLYEGRPLKSAERIFWTVKVWDQNQVEYDYCEPTWFETGLFNKSDWKGEWLSFLGGMIGNGIQLRHYFETDGTKITRARAYVCVTGYYEFRLNGSKIGDKLLSPAPTDISKTVLYSVYDITENMRIGGNVLGAVLGTGFAYLPKILLQINIDYEDGHTQEIHTRYGTDWCVSRGPITYNSIYDGEDYDARMEKIGWDTPEYEHTALLEHQRPNGWIMATMVEDPGGERVAEIMPPIKVREETDPVLLNTFEDGTKLYDSGNNHSGWVAINVRGESGAKVELSFAEVLTPEGKLDKVPLRSARCEDHYTLKGDPNGEYYEPRFTYHGYRYFTVKVIGNAEVTGLKSKFAFMNLNQASKFSCDNEMFNQICDAMRRTDGSNFMGIPTDCAQRDERHGWATDPTSNCEGAVYTYDVASFFIKWLRDLYDTKEAGGYFGDTAPYRWGYKPNDPQANSPVMFLLLMYKMYGDKREMELHFDDILDYIKVLSVESDDWLIARSPYGEWACPKDECFPEEFGPGANPKNVSFQYVATTYFYYTLVEMIEMAEILGRREIGYLRSMKEVIRNKMLKTFYHPETGQYDKGTQSANAMALMFKLADEEETPVIVKHIVDDVIAHDYHVTTGTVGTKAVYQALCENGYDDVAFKLMNQTTSPSFGYMIENGGTTMWERWEPFDNNNIMNSYNHPMFAQACVYFYKYLGGIRLGSNSKGEQTLCICPLMSEGLNEVHAEVETISGLVKSDWKKDGSKTVLDITIPQNVCTEIKILKKFGAVESIECSEVQKAAMKEISEDDCAKFCVPGGKYRLVLQK